MAAPAADAAPRKQEAMQHLIKNLAHNEKKVRDKSLKILQRWLSGKADIQAKDMVKIWQALFYCMWHSDKVGIQQELAQRLSKLIHILSTAEASLHFISAFWRIMRRDWHTIDRLRLDKYLSLLRIFMSESFNFLKNKRWDVRIVQGFAEIFTDAEGPFAENGPLGISLHITDTSMEELCLVDTEVPAASLNVRHAALVSFSRCQIILHAFLTVLKGAQNPILTSRLRENVFAGLLTKHMHEPTSRCKNLNTKEWARNFFDTAASTEVGGRTRKLLYNLHTLYTSPPKYEAPAPKRNVEQTQEESQEAANVETTAVEEVNEGHLDHVEDDVEKEAPKPTAKHGSKKRTGAATTPTEHNMSAKSPKKVRKAPAQEDAPAVEEKEAEPLQEKEVCTPMKKSRKGTAAPAPAVTAPETPEYAPSSPLPFVTPPKRILRSTTKGQKKNKSKTPSPAKQVSWSEAAEVLQFQKNASPKMLLPRNRSGAQSPAAAKPKAVPSPSTPAAATLASPAAKRTRK